MSFSYKCVIGVLFDTQREGDLKEKKVVAFHLPFPFLSLSVVEDLTVSLEAKQGRVFRLRKALGS